MNSSSRDLSHTASVKPDRNAEIIRLRREGVRPREIARRMGLSPNIVAGVLKRANMVDQTARCGGWNNPMPDHIKAGAVAMAKVANRNRAAKAYGVSFDTVNKWLAAS